MNLEWLIKSAWSNANNAITAIDNKEQVNAVGYVALSAAHSSSAQAVYLTSGKQSDEFDSLFYWFRELHQEIMKFYSVDDAAVEWVHIKFDELMKVYKSLGY